MQGIYDAVGDKIRTIFNQADVGIRIIDPLKGIVHFPYTSENGQRVVIESAPIREGGFGGHIIRTRETLVINENMAQEMIKYGSQILPAKDGRDGLHDTKEDASSIYVPLVAGDQVLWAVNTNMLSATRMCACCKRLPTA